MGSEPKTVLFYHSFFKIPGIRGSSFLLPLYSQAICFADCYCTPGFTPGRRAYSAAWATSHTASEVAEHKCAALSYSEALVLPARCLDLDLNIHASRQVEPHQHVNRLRIGVENINQTIVRPNLKVLVRVLINKG